MPATVTPAVPDHRQLAPQSASPSHALPDFQAGTIYMVAYPRSTPPTVIHYNQLTASPKEASRVIFTNPIWPPDARVVPARIEEFLPELSPQDRAVLQPIDDKPTAPWEPPEEQPQS